MLNRIIDFTLAYRWLVLVGILTLLGIGGYALYTIPVEAFPDLTNNQVVVITEAPSLPPSEIEQLVTYPIERAMLGLPNKEEVRSLSKLGLSMITVVFDDSVPPYLARQLVSERVQQISSSLPQGVQPVLGLPATAFGELYQYTLSGPMSSMELKDLHEWVIKSQLRTIPGVSEINAWGGQTKQYQIVVDPSLLQQYRLTLHDVAARIAENNTNFGGGYIEHAAEQYTIRGTGRAVTTEDFGNIVLMAKDGVPVLLRDVAEVRIGSAPPQGATLRNGETVSGMVIMLKGENGKQLIERVKEKIAGLRLPPGVKIIPFYDQAFVIDGTIHTVEKNLFEGFVLVTVVLLLFLGNLRAALITASIIPFSMLISFLGMRLFGISANLMSLGAIDFGMIVDGAVVMMENSVHRLEERHEQESTLESVRQAAHEVVRPMTFAVVIIISVYLPILFLQGLEGRMFRPMAITVCAALFGSLILALTMIPMLADETISGVKADLAVKVFGDDFGTLDALGQQVLRSISTVRGAADAQMEVTSGVAELSVQVDRGALARYGLNVSDVEETVTAGGSGDIVSEVIDGQKRYTVALHLPDRYRTDPDAMRDILLHAPGGEQVPLDQVAQISVTRGPEKIEREEGQRRIVVMSNVRGRDLGSFVSEVRSKLDHDLALPPGYFVEYGGQFENQQRATRRLTLIVPVAIGIVFVLLYLTFNSVTQALLVVGNVPFALVGGIAALWIRGMNLNLSASIGFIALFGVAMLNGVVLVSSINQLRQSGASSRTAVIAGAKRRLRPVLMTACVASFGFLPMAVSTSTGAEVQRPLASVVIGGLLSATVLTLFLLPVLYDWAFQKKVATGGAEIHEAVSL